MSSDSCWQRHRENINGCTLASLATMRQLVFIFTFIGELISDDNGCCRLTQTFVWHHTRLKLFYGL